jgi:hypothetical protein
MGGNIANITSLGFDSNVSNLSQFKMVAWQYDSGTLTNPILETTLGTYPLTYGQTGPASTVSYPFTNIPSVFVTLDQATGPSRYNIITYVGNVGATGFDLDVYTGGTNPITKFRAALLAIGI